jgi:hypothetical protein
VKIPKELEPYNIYLSNMRFKWSDRANGFVSQPITAIVSVFGTPVLKDFTVSLAIRYIRSGDRGTQMGLLVELPGKDGLPGNYYLYKFERIKRETILKVFTSDKALQSYMATLKEDKTKGKDISYSNVVKGAAEELSKHKSHIGG